MSVYEVWHEVAKCPAFPNGIRRVIFPRKDYETAEAQNEAVLDLVRGCRFSDTNYYVFKDDDLLNL